MVCYRRVDCPIMNYFRCLVTLGLALAGGILMAAPGNSIVLNLEPNAATPRNSEGAFVILKSGRILLLYTQFYGGSGDDSPARIVQVHSDDAGRTWSAEPVTVVENNAGNNVMSVSLLRLQSGRIALFYLVKNSELDCRAVMRISRNEAESWSEPRLVGEAPGYFVLNNDRVIQLRSGRLIAPVAYHRSRTGEPRSPRTFDPRAITLWFLSDDEGATWREADDWWALGAVTRTGLQEPGVVELADGHLFSWMRTDQGAQFGCVSTNGGKNWSAVARTSLLSPVSPASIKRLPNSATLLAVFNDHSGQFSFPPCKRTPLVAALSTDNGKTWPRRRVLEDDPDGWYCYTAIHFTDDAVLLAYSAGDSKVGGLNRLRVRRFDRAWLESPSP